MIAMVVDEGFDGHGIESKTDKEGKMTRDEFLELEAPEAAQKLNDLLAAGKSQDEAMAEFSITKAELMKAQVFFVKDKYIARAWGGYTSTKRTGNEANDDEKGVGNSDPSKGYSGI
jgi:hypothetical protein